MYIAKFPRKKSSKQADILCNSHLKN